MCRISGSAISAIAVAALASTAALVVAAAFVDVWQQRQLPRALDRAGDLALVASTRPGDAPGADLPLFGDELSEADHVLVVDLLDLVTTVLAWLAPSAARPTLLVSTADWLAAAARFCH
jgi:hypothetical protein